MLGSVLSVAACLVPLSSAWFFHNTGWSGLSVKFGLNPLDSTILNSLPRTEHDAIEEGWTRIAGCDNEGKFRGVRYVKDDDYAIVLLYDVNGYIAGIQCGIIGSHNYPPEKQKGNIFQQDGNRYMLTAYFTDPASICTSGRSHAQFDAEGTGSDLYIQNGSDPLTQSVRIPKNQEDVTHTRWTLGHCFIIRMGVHYWYDVSEDMDCADFQPVFLLYNRGRLNAFGWALGIDQASTRFEHPPHRKISMFMDPVPRCLRHYPRLSTMHIYLTASPSLNFC